MSKHYKITLRNDFYKLSKYNNQLIDRPIKKYGNDDKDILSDLGKNEYNFPFI